jgi:formylglycine-generating enzyme required for sulfatase activity
LRSTLFSINDLLLGLNLCDASHQILFADRGRSDLATARERSAGGSLKWSDIRENGRVRFGFSSDEQAFDHSDFRHGVSTNCPIDQLIVAGRTGNSKVNTIAMELHLAARKLLLGLLLPSSSMRTIANRDAILLGADPVAEAGEVITNSVGIKLILIPAGEFLMGSPLTEPERYPDESPTHRVQITKPFYCGVYEISQEEYEAIMGTNPSYFATTGGGKANVKGSDTRRFPVEWVSWDDATDFCAKLSQREDKKYRLPTEAEWEYACRARSSFAFSFGATLNGRSANLSDLFPYPGSQKGPFLGRPTSIGQYPANAFGLYDMHGNVREWCADWYDAEYYAKSPLQDPQGPSKGIYRISRGGGFNDTPSYCRSAHRFHDRPTDKQWNFGFRVVRER